MNTRISLIFTLVFVLILAGCRPAQAPATPTMPPTLPPTALPADTPLPTLTPIPLRPTMSTTQGLSTAKPRYAAEGPYQVGRQEFVLPDTEEQLKIYVLYPEQNLAPDAAHGPYPLVIFSPGLGADESGAESLSPYLSPIASYGFIVVIYNTQGEPSDEDFWAGAAYRPMDFQRIIDFSEKLTAQGGKLAGMINTDRSAAAGISSGGWTALIAGGAQMDLGWCTAKPDLVSRLGLSNCPQFVPHEKEIAAMLGLPSAPSGKWPQMNDPRVVAVMSLSPDGDIWGPEYDGVASLKVPTLIMGGTADKVNLPELCAYPIYEHLGSKDKTLVMFEGAKHGLSWEIYSDTILHIEIAFLLAKLKDDPQAARALLRENMNLPGVKYQTTFTGTQ